MAMRRMTILATAITFLASTLGCMSLSFFDRTELMAPDGNYSKQVGRAHLRPGEELVVYYPGGYATPPNLVVDDAGHDCRIIEQRPDGFVVRNMSTVARDVDWTARGTRIATQNAPASATVPASATTPSR
jgi:hypothetical protein